MTQVDSLKKELEEMKKIKANLMSSEAELKKSLEESKKQEEELQATLEKQMVESE
jgi:septal ring factor EnvC (AmiA/AmiB activator)